VTYPLDIDDEERGTIGLTPPLEGRVKAHLSAPAPRMIFV